MLYQILLCLLAIANARRALTEVEYKGEFTKYVREFNKDYEGAFEWAYRYESFKLTLDDILDHNAGNATYTKGLNEFSDMSETEFGEWKGGCYNTMKQSQRMREMEGKVKELGVATCTSIDWTAQGAVTPVKNQGQCGSCWAFSTTGSIEGRCEISKGKLISLSEQELVDCPKVSDGNMGCNGGLMDNAFKWIENNGGLCTEDDYPYKAKKTIFGCKKSGCTSKDPISGYHDVPANNQAQLEAAVCQGPVSIAIEADQSSFQSYSGGVFTGVCGAKLDHGVLIVGFGTDNGKDYWKVKNSWGASWGESGYIRIERGSGDNGGAGKCGILSNASYPDC